MASYHGGATAPNLSEKPRKPKRQRLTATKPKFGAKQKTTGGVEQRARGRLRRTGPISGVNAKDGITGREARKIRRVARREGVLKPRPNRSNGKNRNPRQRDPLARELNALDRLQFGPQLQELDFERRRSAQHMTNLTGWYGQHVQDMQNAQARHQAFAAGIHQGQLQATQQAATVDAGQNAQQVAKMQADAEKRGTQVDPALLATMQQGVAARQTMGNAGAALIGAQGQAQSAHMGTQIQAGAEQGLQARQDQAERDRALDSVAMELARDRGAARTKNRMDLQEMYWKRRLEEAVFGLDQAELAADIADDRADNRRQARNDRFSRRDRRADNRRADRAERRQERNTRSLIRDRRIDNRRMDRDDDGKVNGSTRDWTHGDRKDYDNALVKLREKDRKHNYHGADRKQVIDGLVKSGMTREVARAAWVRFIRQKRRQARRNSGQPPHARGPNNELRPR